MTELNKWSKRWYPDVKKCWVTFRWQSIWHFDWLLFSASFQVLVFEKDLFSYMP